MSMIPVTLLPFLLIQLLTVRNTYIPEMHSNTKAVPIETSPILPQEESPNYQS